METSGYAQTTAGTGLKDSDVQWYDLSDKLRKAQETHNKSTCPSCGHCPTCGRGGYHWPWPTYPSIPYSPYYPSYPYITWSSGVGQIH
jgi:hypothetical protein